MVNIRNNIFETNSSSVHTIAISRNDDYRLPKHISFKTDEYGWETRVLSGRKLANYLYTATKYSRDPISYQEYIEQTLAKHGVKCEFYPGGGYIDHGDELVDFLNELYFSEEKLLRFLFSDESFIVTGNDNDDYYKNYITEINTKDFDIYEK